ncbi:MAG: hypothetical protein CMF62_03605 [Magnetococcales bacterium]|nr:hypothetical protein [Magnetococcales bacterium]
MVKKVEVQNEDVLDELSIDSEEFGLTISTKESMKETIHDIHNFLRNNGAGYGMNALKLFTLFYGLAKIENNGHFKSSNLPDTCKFSNIRNKLKENCEIGYEYVNEEVIQYIYENDKINRMLTCEIPESITGNILHLLVEKVYELVKKEKKLNFQLAGKIYEYFIGRDQTAISELGAYFTDRHITEYIYNNVLQPTLDKEGNVQSMVDMFGGSGGFTLGYLTYLIEKYPDIDWKTQINNVYHYDMNLDVVKYAMLEFYCLTGYFPSDENLRTMNSFSENFKETQDEYKTYHYIVTNPPYGGDKVKKGEQEAFLELIKSKLEEYFKSTYKVRNMKEMSKKTTLESDEDTAKLKQYDTIYSKLKKIDEEKRSKTVSLDSSSVRLKHFAKENNLDIKKFNDKESVSFLMLLAMLAKDGVAVGVLKEGVFFDKKYAFLRKFCVENYNVEMVVSIDASQFENTSTKTSIIKIRNNGRTKKIKFYDLVVEKDEKNELAENKDGTYRVDKIKDRITNVYHKLVSVGKYDDVVKEKYSFNGKDYNKKEIVCGEGYELKKLNNICKISLGDRITKANSEEGNIPVYGGGNITFYTNKNNRNGKNLVISRYAMSKENTRLILGNFYLNDSGLSIHSINEFSKDYINYLFLSDKLQKIIYNYLTKGSIQKNIDMNSFRGFKIPIPKKESKIKSWTDKISKPYDLKHQKEEKLNNLEEEVQNEIQRITEEEDCEEKELGDVCEYIKTGKHNKKLNGNLYPYYGTSKILGMTEKYDLNGNHISVARKGDPNIRILQGKFSVNDDVIVLKTSIVNHYYIFTYLLLNINDKHYNGSTVKGIKKTFLEKFKVKLPKDKSLIEALEPKFKKIETLKEEIDKLDTEYKQYVQELADEAMPPDLNKEVDFKE